MGCCQSQPCTNSCPDGNLRPASFDMNSYGTFPDQQCPSGSRWYTCTGVSPPFMGCCKSNPCSKGCPVGDLAAGFLSSNPKVASPFLTSSASSSTSSSISSSSHSTSASSRSSSSTSSSPISSSTNSSSIVSPLATSTPAPSASTGVIANAAVGGVAVVAV